MSSSRTTQLPRNSTTISMHPNEQSRLITLDASVCVPWVISEQSNKVIDALFQEGYKGSVQLLAPALWLWECGNVMLQMVKRGRLREQDMDDSFALLRYAKVQVEGVPNALVQAKTLQWAVLHGLTYYDAAYLELAHRKASLLATLDQDLKRAATNAGVQCLAL